MYGKIKMTSQEFTAKLQEEIRFQKTVVSFFRRKDREDFALEREEFIAILEQRLEDPSVNPAAFFSRHRPSCVEGEVLLQVSNFRYRISQGPDLSWLGIHLSWPVPPPLPGQVRIKGPKHPWGD